MVVTSSVIDDGEDVNELLIDVKDGGQLALECRASAGGVVEGQRRSNQVLDEDSGDAQRPGIADGRFRDVADVDDDRGVGPLLAQLIRDVEVERVHSGRNDFRLGRDETAEFGHVEVGRWCRVRMPFVLFVEIVRMVAIKDVDVTYVCACTSSTQYSIIHLF